MKYYELLQTLKRGNHTEIIDILNKSTYAEYYSPANEPTVINTGFTCRTQNDKILMLLYDITNKVIIRQVYNKDFAFPPICGVAMFKSSSGFYDDPSNGYLAGIFTNNETTAEVGDFKDASFYFYKPKVDTITVYDPDEKKDIVITHVNIYDADYKLVDKIPLQMKHQQEVFYTGERFIIVGDPRYDENHPDYGNPYI